MLNRQAAFDTALTHLRVQGKVATTEHGMCLYRGPNGTKCAVGALIPDDRYDPYLEGRGAGNAAVIAAIPDATHADSHFLMCLQSSLHDSLEDKPDFLAALEREAGVFAGQFRLVYTPPAPAV